MAGVTAAGFELKELIDIITDMDTEARVQFGADVDLSSTSPLQKFIQVVAAEQALLWLELERAYYAGYFDFAASSNLDNMIAIIGMVRQPAVKAAGAVTFTGTESKSIPAGFEVQTAGSSPIIFTTDEPVTISGGVATVDITAKVSGLDGNVAANTIIVITHPETGIDTVTNAAVTSGGEDAETDEALRNRIKLSLSSAGAATLDAIRAGVLDVTGLSACALEENDTITDYTPGGLPAKSFRVTALGGADDDIGQAIFDNKPAGIQAYGDVSGNAVSDDGTAYVMWFRRPDPIDIYVDVILTTDSTFPTDGLALVENAIITYIGGTDLNAVEHLGLDIGADVIFNEVVATVMDIQGVTDVVVGMNTTGAPVVETANISIATTEKAVTSTTLVTVA